MNPSRLKIWILLAGLIWLISATLSYAGNEYFDWHKYVGNPVLDVTGATVVHDGTQYRMWYTTSAGIEYATSSDGITWNKYAGNPVLTPLGEPPIVDCAPNNQIGNPSVVFDGTQWQMWYTTGCRYGILHYYYWISYATSNDGVSWTKYANNPVLSHDQAWEQQAVDNATVVLHDGLYRMWYSGTASGYGWRPGYATSLDGIHWTKYANNPISHFVSSVIFYDSEYHAWFPTYNALDGSGIWHATSLDGITWVDDPANPILSGGSSGEWDNVISNITTIYHDGQMQMWYEGSDAIGYAAATILTPQLAINHIAGAPGSFFAVTATGFPPTSTVAIRINGHVLTDTLVIGSAGNFAFILETQQANPGRYVVTLEGLRTASVAFVLDSTASIWPQEGSGPILSIPADIAFTKLVYLPVLSR